MGEPLENDLPQDLGGDTEEIDAVVVTPTPRAIQVRRAADSVVPAVQAAAVAATGFVAGAALAGLVHRRGRRRDLIRLGPARRLGRREGGGRGRRSSRGAGELVQIVGSRSLLVDVHLLGGRD
ncbi:MAG TPA: hypothetical protein VNY52_12670 [Solirubrobacteraceae bacterium]|jgi:hypothetical protein|nr:hypothetical protein [Solirubrobacteraceae bacterium]